MSFTHLIKTKTSCVSASYFAGLHFDIRNYHSNSKPLQTREMFHTCISDHIWDRSQKVIKFDGPPTWGLEHLALAISVELGLIKASSNGWKQEKKYYS